MHAVKRYFYTLFVLVGQFVWHSFHLASNYNRLENRCLVCATHVHQIAARFIRVPARGSPQHSEGAACKCPSWLSNKQCSMYCTMLGRIQIAYIATTSHEPNMCANLFIELGVVCAYGGEPFIFLHNVISAINIHRCVGARVGTTLCMRRRLRLQNYSQSFCNTLTNPTRGGLRAFTFRAVARAARA